ncbi:Maf-like protein [Leptospira selangorensis]|uniref:dTTP/UTP pyrophosphatase n=1 Tax=Leptospira selangorensis TaxID=2484982 RepID=A0A4R9GDD5_9LEPT|nr:nucleoside triphosphate pyrophosphatase [Leptospira selangorensis]TGK09220.1 Maf-like protein [Leptospira selangorensis]TGM15951.1 Maf-like protein [Leptospira selangorensis]TGM18099.1 Maf-like protein [Leptospira selangorensis]
MLILRSQSPRRKEILQSLGLHFQILPLPIDETSLHQETPVSYLERVTLAKLGPKPEIAEEVILASDTIVVFQNKILQKPADESEAFSMISELSGKTHQVFSGLGIMTKDEKIFNYDVSEVEFHPWNKSEILEYIKICKPYDKAGSYGIQDPNSPAKNFQGSYSNILGFPIRKFFLYHTLWSRFL